ncbi:hypothetical protein HaLaN_29217 [Haematococcus lacustris]|uniref:Uncharacterized protein n=1 Tax=Haematococcus lacustris TaxID=44745 RepID=A0A6A0ADH0_HAELA|nr:hypothetical protein HaLaN_29217 [Haematococcus lacustris]
MAAEVHAEVHAAISSFVFKLSLMLRPWHTHAMGTPHRQKHRFVVPHSQTSSSACWGPPGKAPGQHRPHPQSSYQFNITHST